MSDPSVHALSIDHTIEGMESHLHLGLSSQEARSRLEQHGPNELTERPRPGFMKLLFAQLNNFLVIILIVAAVVSLLLGEVVDAVAIMAIVVLNAVLGVVQESKAEQALAALKRWRRPTHRWSVTAYRCLFRPASWCQAIWCCWRPAITSRRICA